MKNSAASAPVRSILKLAFPIAFTLLANNLLQIVDLIFVGKLGAPAIGAVSIGTGIYCLLMIVGVGLLVSLDYLVSYSFGAKDYRTCNTYLVHGVYTSLLVCIPGIFAMYVISNNLVKLGVVPEVAILAKQYLQALSWSLIPFLVYFSFRQYLQAMGFTAVALYLTLAANVINAGFNQLFIFGYGSIPALGVVGSGIATSFARLFMLIGIIIYTLYHAKKHGLSLTAVSLKPSAFHFREILKLGAPAAGQLALEVGVFATVGMLSGRLGAIPLAANAIILQIISTVFMIPLGISSAAAVLISRCLGIKDFVLARQTGWAAYKVTLVTMLLLCLLIYFFATPVQSIFTSDPEIIKIGSTLLIIASLFQLSDGLQVVGTGVLRGAGNTRTSLIVNFFGHWTFGLPTGYLLCFILGYGVYGLWFGLATGLTIVALVLLWYWTKRIQLGEKMIG